MSESFCKNCGKEVDDNADVCVNCGRLVKEQTPIISNDGQSIVKKVVFWQ